jgi:valyl-tRNA synthetase
MLEISKQYNPKEVEDKWYKFWEDNNLFKAAANLDKKSFCIVIPPPNVTGILHMGHALNNTYQDILIRFARMNNFQALWMPGTDHAGIATQNVVERQLAKEGLTRQDLGREKFLERVWAWRQQYGSTIINQLKKLGASCDWQRTRFTMDEAYSQAVAEVFISLWDKGLIYQGDKVINWCPRCQTALSDEEAPHQELESHLYYLKYPFKDNASEFVTVATTRPETMLGDSAVAINPKDRRYKKFIGKTLILPLIGREIKIIADNIVDMKFGTGAVKVTPAHDPNDYALGKIHNLEFINIMNPNGILNNKAGRYQGLDRFKARQLILEDLKNLGLLEKIEPHKLSVGHCYRCHTIIEPYLSRQWFVKMKPLAKPAIDAVKKAKIKFYPSRWEKVYLNWMENIQDWCISRQIWWGHRLPVYYCNTCLQQADELTVNSEQLIVNKNGIIVSKTKPEKCPTCSSTDIYQDSDVLDTWFSSWLWPFATFGWPAKDEKIIKDLKYFYPTSALVTAPEIIFFWVARMIMAGFEFMKDIPFSDVYIHGTVRDIQGKKMSKSLGNIIDPLDVISEYGADALRFSLVSITSTGQDVFLSKEKFEMGRNFANKIWNASRFILMNVSEQALVNIEASKLNIQERWILSRLNNCTARVSKQLKAYEFSESAKQLYEFFWHEFCDWFIEIAKEDIASGRQMTKAVLVLCLKEFLKLIHPLMPFISEEIWSRLPNVTSSIMIEPYPVSNAKLIDKKIDREMEFFISLISRVRNLRVEASIEPQKPINCLVSVDSKKDLEFLESLSAKFKQLTKSETTTFAIKIRRPTKAIASAESGFTIYLKLEGTTDIANQLSKLEKQIDLLEQSIKNTSDRLENKEFLKNAPEEIVNQQEEKLETDKNTLEKIKQIYNALRD